MSNKQKIFCCKFCERNFYEHERKQHEQQCKVKRAIEEHEVNESENNRVINNAQNNENPYNNVMGEDTKLAWQLLSNDANNIENNKKKLEMFKDGYPNN